jgi:hypothetical protein
MKKKLSFGYDYSKKMISCHRGGEGIANRAYIHLYLIADSHRE